MRDDPKWNIQFVKTVEKYPVLYDAGNEGYCSKDTVEEAWREVASAMRESVINCKDKWRNLRTSLTRHLRNMNEPSALSGKYRRPYYMAPYMSFLIPYTKSRSYKAELLSAERPRRSSFDCSADRSRYLDRGDSSSYDNSPILDDHKTARPHDREEDRQGTKSKGFRANQSGGGATAGDHDGGRRVQPKLEEPDDDVEWGEDYDGEVYGGGEDVVDEEEKEDGGEELVVEEQEGGEMGRKRRRVAGDATVGEPPSESASALEGSTGERTAVVGSSAVATSSRVPGGTTPAAGPVGARPGRVGGEAWDAGPAREMDDDSWSGWMREGELEGWPLVEERRGVNKVTRGIAGVSRQRVFRLGHLDGRNAHLNMEQLPESNADMDFFRSILSDVNSLNPSQRSKFRLSVLKTLHEMLYNEQ
ncbi:uncharacterized protein [Hetaerina americana]|uniref:uncharacterized protein n=1 Tax=Hetaerina americana TaxID=62018 RepID=UPI003A7F3288